MKYLYVIEITLFIAATTLIVAASNNNEPSILSPETNWRNSLPEEQGIDSEQLARIFNYVQENNINIHSLILIRNDYLVLEAYFYPNSKGIIHDVASVTKSITSVLIGIAIEKGFIKNVHQPVLDFFDGQDIANFDNRKKLLMIEHLLTMRTGLCRNFLDGERQLDNMRQTDDWVRYMLDQPMLTKPGTGFAYCTEGEHTCFQRSSHRRRE